MTIAVHALQRDKLIYAVEIDHEVPAIVSIYDVHNSCFVDDDRELEVYILDCFNKGLLPPMEHSQWLSKAKEEVLFLNYEDFNRWVNQMKIYCCRRRDYCDKKYGGSPMMPDEALVMQDLYPHWTWYFCSQLKEISGSWVLMREGDSIRKDDACDIAMSKWTELTGLQP